MIINVNESMTKLKEIRDNNKKIDKELQEIERLFQELEEAPETEKSEH